MTELHDVIRRSRNLAPTTRERYLRNINQWIAFAGEDPANWTRLNAQAFYDHLIDVKGLRPQSADRVIMALQYASRWRAHFANRDDLHFALVQKAQAYEFDQKRALEQSEVVRLLTSIGTGSDPAALRDFAIVVTLLETGMRRMSLVSMSIERTLTDEERLKSIRALYPLAWVRMKGSGTADVAAPLSDTAVTAIARWRAWLAVRGITKGPLFCGLDQKMGPRGPVTTAARTPIAPNAINKMLDRRAADAGIGHIYPHQFRHTFVTWRAAAGLQMYEIASITGHGLRRDGGIYGYLDKTVIAQKVRNATPAWLRELVMGPT